MVARREAVVLPRRASSCSDVVSFWVGLAQL